MLTDGRTDGRTTDARVTGILIAHLGAFGSGELKINKRWTPLTNLSGSAHAEHSITKFHIILSFQSAHLPEKISELSLICITNFGKRTLRSISRRHVANFDSQKNINVSRMNSIK